MTASDASHVADFEWLSVIVQRRGMHRSTKSDLSTSTDNFSDGIKVSIHATIIEEKVQSFMVLLGTRRHTLILAMLALSHLFHLCERKIEGPETWRPVSKWVRKRSLELRMTREL